MPCPSQSYGGAAEVDRPWRNWLGNISYRVPRYFEPSTRQDLVWILKEAELAGKRVKAVGSGWSFEDCAVSEDWVVDLRALNRTIGFLTDAPASPPLLAEAWRDRQFGASDAKLFHVEAGVTVFELNRRLHDLDLAMPTLGGSQGQTLAGAISTSTHGSDLDQPPIAGAAQAIHLVTTGGQEIWIERESEPVTADDARLLSELGCPDLRIIRSDGMLRAAMVAVGRFGVIYAYVLKVTRRFELSEWTQELPWASVANALRAGVGLGEAAPVRAHLGGAPSLLAAPPAALDIAAEVNDFRFLDILINPRARVSHHDPVCWVRRRWWSDNRTPVNVEQPSNPICHAGVANTILAGAAAALSNYALLVLGIPIYGIGKSIQIGADAAYLSGLALDPSVTGGEALTESLNALWRAQITREFEPLIADLNSLILFMGMKESIEQGKRGPSWQISSGTSERSNDDCYRAQSAEIVFDTGTGAYIDFVETLLDNAFRHRFGGYVSLRFSSRTDASLSMHNVATPLAVSIEVAAIDGFEGSESWTDFVETTGKAMGGRPHWGQQNTLTLPEVMTLYEMEDLRDWWHQCFLITGRDSATFSNGYTRRRGLEPRQRRQSGAASATPPAIQFGRVLSGASVDEEIAVASVGATPIRVDGIRLAGPDRASFALAAAAAPATLEPGAAVPISVKFRSTRLGEHRAEVEIATLDERSARDVTIRAPLAATVVAPALAVFPATINFAFVEVGQEAERNFAVQNNGNAPLRLKIAPVHPTSAFQWESEHPIGWRELAGGEAAIVRIRFRPLVAGPASTQIVVESDTQKDAVQVVGEGVAPPRPRLQIIPARGNFGAVEALTASLQFALINDGAAALALGGARIAGPDRTRFSLPASPPGRIEAGRSAMITVTFAPRGFKPEGDRAALVVESDAGEAPLARVPLLGVGAKKGVGTGWLEPVIFAAMAV